MTKPWARALALGAAALTLSLQVGCVRVGRNVKTVINRYEVGSFNAASRQCSELAQLQDEMNEKAHVRYLVYCGLTHYRLGRRPNAQLLLSRGVDEYQQGRSSWIKPGIADEMYKALDDLEGRPHARVTPPPFERHSRRNKQVDVEADASEEEDDE